MRWGLIFALVLLSAECSLAQNGAAQSSPLDDWMRENIDPDVLRLLNQLDEDKVQKILAELQQAMAGTNLYKLGTLRDTARQVIPLLEEYDETAPLGEWLKSQLEYLEAAHELEREEKAAEHKGGPARSLPPPSMKLERQVWKQRLERQPWPPSARIYLPELKRAFAAEGAPPELAWLAEVESSFNPKARSPAGAAGLFQLMPQIARQEQLSLWPWDQRYNPEKSAHAAARCLRQLHTRYGDWPLALAAYNAGAGRVNKLMKQHKAASYEAIAPYLPAETQLYVPRVEATVREREGKELSSKP